jgi:hypothetical protein
LVVDHAAVLVVLVLVKPIEKPELARVGMLPAVVMFTQTKMCWPVASKLAVALK